MKSGYDIKKIVHDGYLICPLSMSRLANGNGQDPFELYDMIEYFFHKLDSYSNDVVLLYTYGLYFNVDSIAYEERRRLNQQAVNHSQAFRSF